jgi:hypothetical protein
MNTFTTLIISIILLWLLITRTWIVSVIHRIEALCMLQRDRTKAVDGPLFRLLVFYSGTGLTNWCSYYRRWRSTHQSILGQIPTRKILPVDSREDLFGVILGHVVIFLFTKWEIKMRTRHDSDQMGRDCVVMLNYTITLNIIKRLYLIWSRNEIMTSIDANSLPNE